MSNENARGWRHKGKLKPNTRMITINGRDIFFEPTIRIIDPVELSEEEITDMEKRHGWRIKR